MSDNIFGDLDIASAADDPFAVTDGTYEALLTKSSVEKSLAKGTRGLTFEYTIHDADDEEMNGRKISEWLTIPTEDDENKSTFMSFIKRRLKSLGVPEDEMNTVQTSELIGIEVVVSVATKTGKDGVDRQNITKLRLANDEEGTTGDWDR